MKRSSALAKFIVLTSEKYTYDCELFLFVKLTICELLYT